MEGCECERKSMKNHFKNTKFRDKHFVAVVHMTITIRSSRCNFFVKLSKKKDVHMK
jgi:hypothetical protein